MVGLTFDAWSLHVFEGFGAITIHWLDDNFHPKSMLLEFHCFPPPHTTITHAQFVYDAIWEYGISSQV